MSLKERILAAEKVALCVIRKWWRPLTCVWIAATMAVHGVVVPLYMLLKQGQAPTDLTALAALVTAVAAAFAVREWGKVKGVNNND